MTNNALVLGGCLLFAYLWNTFCAELGVTAQALVLGGVLPGDVVGLATIWVIPNIIILAVGLKTTVNLS
jgi:hypothetical protein